MIEGLLLLLAAMVYFTARMARAWYHHDIKNENSGEWNRV